MPSFPARKRTSFRAVRRLFALFVIVALIYSITPLQGFIQTTPTAGAAAADLFFSEYVEASGNNKALEIYNATGEDINLGANSYNIQMFFNGSGTSTFTINLSGTIAKGATWVVTPTNADPAVLTLANQSFGTAWFNGNDAVVLRKGTTVIDSIGQVGNNPGTEWGTGLTSTADNTLRRLPTVCGGDTITNDAFNPAAQWEGFANNTFSGLGTHTSNCVNEAGPAVNTTSPAAGATDVSIGTNINVNFNEPVNVSGSWFTISCTTSGLHTAAVTGGPVSYTLNPDSDFAYSETCTVTVNASQVSDQDVNDPPDFMAANHQWSFTTGADPCTSPFTKIPVIQGDGAASERAGEVHLIRGVVVGDFQGGATFGGVYLQDPAGDGNTATSDGIFVFAPSAPNVAVGDDVAVKGTVMEFNGLTELTNAAVTRCGQGGSIEPTIVDLPETVEGELERYEGMLISIPETLTVTEVFNLGRFGEVMLSSDGRLFQPTNFLPPSSAPGSPTQLEFNSILRRKILLDDGLNIQNPNPIPYLGADNTRRVGDRVEGVTGVLDYRFNEYRIQPTAAPVFTSANPRTAAPAAVGGNVKVASFNVLNYFNGNGAGGGFPTSRGATDLAEFQRQRAKIIAALTAIDADVVGLIEMESDGGGPQSAVQDLVNGLNAATAPGTYDFRVGQNPGTDLIQNAIIYKPARVQPVGPAVNDVDTDGDNAWDGARNPLAQTFQATANGEKFTFIVNHFTSKGCSANDTGLDADQGDGQGCDNLSRINQAHRLLYFIEQVKADAGDPDVLVMGDLNAYGAEDPINILTQGGLVNEIDRFIEGPYSYVFQALSGYLDHALATATMDAQVTGVTEWHINADEPLVLDYNTEFKTQDLYEPTPYRSSDHDPVIVGLDLNAPPVVGPVTATPNPAVLNGEVSFSANFTDADSGDTHTATWEWGDGSSSPGTISGGAVTGSHTYTAVGTYTVTLTVTDSHNNTDTSTVQVQVGYGVVALYDETKAHKSGSTIPVKLQLVDASGANLSNPSLTVHVTGISPAPSGTDFDSGNANPGANFRYDPSLGGYIFNLSTKGLAPGQYTLSFTVTGDPVTHTVKFVVR